MLHRLPRALPPAALMLEDLGHPTAEALAAGLGVSARTVQRWRGADEWPRLPRLALFYASRWGWTLIESEALHTLHTHRALVSALQQELELSRADVARITALGLHGSANDPGRYAPAFRAAGRRPTGA